MSSISPTESQGSEEEEGEIKEPVKKTKAMEESEEEDLVLRFGEESNESVELKKRKRSVDENSSHNIEKDHLKLVEDDLKAKMEIKRVKCEFAKAKQLEGQNEPIINIKIEKPDEDECQLDAVVNIIEDDEMNHHKEKPIKKNVFSNEALMKVQDIFGINFDNEIFGKYGKEEYEEDENDVQLGDYKSGEKSKNARKQTKKKSTKKSVYDIYEPSQLRRVHSINLDKEICATDIPERMQLRLIPVTPVKSDSNELDLESKWIYEQAFYKETVSIQNNHSDEEEERLKLKIHNRHQTIGKIKNVLHFIRNQQFEVPFISTYRKEFIYPELDTSDLWKVYNFDGKWCQLQQRKKHLIQLFESMLSYQLNEVAKYTGTSLPASLKIVKIADIERLKNTEVSEEIHDIYRYFKLHYSHEIPAMKRFIRQKKCEAIRERLKKRKNSIEGAKENEEHLLENMENQDLDESVEIERNDPYFICKKAGLDSFIKKFGLTSEQFAENLRDGYQRHEIDQELYEPITTASRFCGKKISAPEKILKSAQFMFAIQLACEPLVRKTLRNLYMKKAKLSVRATKKGIKEIDESHPIYSMKYLKNKPVKDLVGDQFLKLVVAEQDELITITFSDTIEGIASNNYIDEIKQFIIKQDLNQTVQAWNALRFGSMEMALTNMVIVDLKKELRANLLFEAKDCVMRECCQKLHNWIKVAPYTSNIFGDEDEEWSISKGIRVMGLSFPSDESQVSYACIVAPYGECTDFLKLPHLLKRRNSLKESEKLMKEADLLLIRNFIAAKKPHVIVIGGESRDTLMIQFEIQEIIIQLIREEQFPSIKVEICDNDLTKIYANSSRAISEFRDYSFQLRQAISIGRRMQDPIIEFSQLCNSDDEILSLKYHSLQDQLPQDELLENIHTEFINLVNQVGVNVNMVAQKYYSENILQFVCGLGPRKAQGLIKILRKQADQKLENRAQLVTICNLGPKVFINCAGFIKIDTNSLADNKGAYVEILDGSRIHPESYEWARKMAVDALESEEDGTMSPAQALEEIIQAPEKLKDLDLDAFVDQLQRQGLGDKKITLYDVCAELSCMYRDFRKPYVPLNREQLFYILTKETPETLYVGKLIVAKVLGISSKKPQGEQIENMRPVRNEETGFWQCLFCFKNDFLELSEVWTHFETSCPGRATGVKIRLDNGITGYIHIKNLSDKTVTNPRERVCVNQPIHCRIIRIDVEKFGIECTSRSKDLADKDNEWRAPKDPFYDMEGEEKEKKLEEEVRKSKLRQTYIKRIIGHPCFKNIDFADAERLMRDKRPGEVIIRPSSKGPNHLTLTWKMADEVIQHIDVIEEGKASDFVLGAKLRIGNDEFEDLDDIFVKFINPMIGFVNEILSFKYYKPRVGGSKDRADEVLKIQKKENPNGIPYIISAARQYPGNFLLSYLPRNQCRHEYFSIIPEGLKFRTEVFIRLNDLIRWFKENFKEPMPNQPIPCTPKGTPPSRTPSYQSTSTGIRDDEFQKETQMSHRQYANQSIYQSNQVGYQSNHSEYPTNHPDYQSNHPEYHSNPSNYQSDHSSYRPIHSEYKSNHSEYKSNHSEYKSNHANYQSNHLGHLSNQSSYNFNHLNYEAKQTSYQSNHSAYQPNKNIYQPNQSVYESKQTVYQSPTMGNSAGYNGKTSCSQNLQSSEKTSLPKVATVSSPSPNPITSQVENNPDTSDNIKPKTTENVKKPSLTWTQQIESKVFDDSYFTKSKKTVLPYDNGVGKGLIMKYAKGKNPLKTLRLGKKKPLDEVTLKPFDFGLPILKTKDGYDNPIIGGSSRESSRSRDNFDDYSRGSSHDQEDYNPFTVGTSHDNYPRSPRDSYQNRSSSPRGRRYSSPQGDRSPSYHSSHSRERSPRYNSRSSWDRSPIHRSNHSRDRSPEFKKSRSSWDRSPVYRRSPSRSRSPFNSRGRERSPGLKNSRSSWDRSPEYRNSPPPERNPQFGSDFIQNKNMKLPPPLPVPTPDNENPFVKGSARDNCHDDGNSSPTEVPKKIFPFNRGRGRGFKSYSANFRGRGAKYDIVSPCEFTQPR